MEIIIYVMFCIICSILIGYYDNNLSFNKIITIVGISIFLTPLAAIAMVQIAKKDRKELDATIEYREKVQEVADWIYNDQKKCLKTLYTQKSISADDYIRRKEELENEETFDKYKISKIGLRYAASHGNPVERLKCYHAYNYCQNEYYQSIFRQKMGWKR